MKSSGLNIILCLVYLFNSNLADLDIIETINLTNLTNPDSIELSTIHLFDLKLSTKIVGGMRAKPFQFPYQAAIFIYGNSGRVLFCGGSLISKKFVITAAHCIFEKPQRILVILGNEKLMVYNKNEVRRDVRRYIIHKRYDRPSLRHDICLLQLNKSIIYTRSIKPISLPKIEDINRNFFNKHAIVSGFGKTSNSGEISRQLMFIELRVMGNDLCNSWFEDKDTTYTNICTSGRDGHGACQGDSGGPLVIEDKLIGLVSFGARYCSLGYPSVYTRVPCYIRWIANYTNIELY